jgi:hypothetical protein
MKYALLTQAQLDTLRPSLGTIATATAARATSIGSRIPEAKRPPQSYSDGAVGWTVPFAVYPQETGRVVVVMEDSAWDRLNPASRALFALNGLPSGFADGTA